MPDNTIARSIGLTCKTLLLIVVVLSSPFVLTPPLPRAARTTPTSISSSPFTDPNLVSITFWEATGGLNSFTFAKNSSQLTTRLADPLGPFNNDFANSSIEFYDVFYSDWNGTFSLSGDFVTIEAVFLAALPSAGGLHIAEVYENFAAGPSQHATFVASFVALGDNAIPGSVGNAADGNLGTLTTMGNTVGQSQRLRITLGFPSSPLPPLVGRVCLVPEDSSACPQTLPKMVADSTGHLNVSVSILGSTVFNAFSITVRWDLTLMNLTTVNVTSTFLPRPNLTTDCINGSGLNCAVGDGPGTVHVAVLDVNETSSGPTSGQLFRMSFIAPAGSTIPVGFATGCVTNVIMPGIGGPSSFPATDECVLVAKAVVGIPTPTVTPVPEGLQSQALGVRLPSPFASSSPNGTIAGSLNSGGPPNYSTTWVMPFTVTLPGNITGWKAQFTGSRTPVGIQIKIIRKITLVNLTVVQAGPIHNPTPVLLSRLPGYPGGVSTNQTVIPIYTDSMVAVLPGDLIGLTIIADPALGSYDYPTVNMTGTRSVQRNVAVGGTINLLDPFTETTSQAPALEVTVQPSPPRLDTTGDGIPDFVALSPEMQSIGVDPCRKTVLVQLNYMDEPAVGFTHKPLQAALDIVTSAFDAAPVPAAPSCPYSGFPRKVSGIKLIFDVAGPIPFQPTLNFTNSHPMSFDTVKATFFDANRAHYFHYGLFIHNIAAGDTTSGVAEKFGTNFMVAMGGWTNDVGSVFEQAGTLMHELGHSLGLDHGGGDSVNYKPNYLSVMSYEHQVVGIFTRTPSGDVQRFDYSREALPVLDEGNLSELQRLSDSNDYTKWVCADHHTVKIDILGNNPDWNCDRQFETGVIDDLNNDTIIGPMSGYDDWANLKFKFTESSNFNIGCTTACDIGCTTACDIGCTTGCDIGCKTGCGFGLELNRPTALAIEARWNAFLTSIHRSTSASLSCTPNPVIVSSPTACTATITDSDASPIAPTGTVSFFSSQPGTFTPPTCSLMGAGASTSCSVSYTPNVSSTGSQMVSAAYSGDENHLGGSNTFTLVTGLSLPSISVSKFFTDTSLNPLPADKLGNPKVDVVIAGGTVTSTNPGQVLAWTNVTNTGSFTLDSLRLNETLPGDWDAHPSWLPAKGAIHVYLVYVNGTRMEITGPNMVAVNNANPEVLTLNISDLGATLARTPLIPGESLLLSVKLVYGLLGTSQPTSTYPRVYTDGANAVSWTKPSYTGSEATGTGFASFNAYAKIVGDVNGDGKVNITDLTLVGGSFGSRLGDPNFYTAADLNHDGRIDIYDLALVGSAFGS